MRGVPVDGGASRCGGDCVERDGSEQQRYTISADELRGADLARPEGLFSMPRRLSEYSAADWKRLRPLTHAYKTLIDNLKTLTTLLNVPPRSAFPQDRGTMKSGSSEGGL